MWTKTRSRWTQPNWRRASRQEPRQSFRFSFSGNRLTWIRFWNSRGHTGFLSLKMQLNLTALSTRAEKQALWATPVASASIPEKISALLARPARSWRTTLSYERKFKSFETTVRPESTITPWLVGIAEWTASRRRSCPSNYAISKKQIGCDVNALCNTIRLSRESRALLRRSRQIMRGTFITSMRFECRNATKFGDSWRRKELAVACTIPFRFTFRRPVEASATRRARFQSRRTCPKNFFPCRCFLN